MNQISLNGLVNLAVYGRDAMTQTKIQVKIDFDKILIGCLMLNIIEFLMTLLRTQLLKDN